ncbi:MAG: tRNA threonylcarbamoyladenosine dehydratase, partial [Muribaculaceae bacterium]|nr:tRNA threonylcarbamoyladenosine dehydratase [Muribaculaceae bacterium]
VLSSMGAGGRLDPTKAGYADLWETREDGLARAVRQRLKKLGLRRPLRVVASSEAPRAGAVIALDERNKRSSYGTLATIPSLFGILLASKVINDLTSPHK